MIFVLARHAESVLNVENRVNGDPSRPAPLTDHGRDEARLLGAQLAHLAIDLCVHTRFQRARETAELAMSGRDVAFAVEPLLDDIDIGELDGLPLEEYRLVKRTLGRKDPFPGGESLDGAALRYTRAFVGLAERNVQRVLVVCHEIPVRYALNAAAGAESLDGPPFHDIANAVPFLFGGGALLAAASRIEQLAS